MELIETADNCPVCNTRPVAVNEKLGNEMRVFLECPRGCPYTFCGNTLLQAVNFWNIYIAFQIAYHSKQMFKKMAENNTRTYCLCCEKFTDTVTRFRKEYMDDRHLGYALIIQQCAVCFLIKSQTEAA